MSLQAVGYCRVSSADQAEDGCSLAAQENAIRTYCSMRNLDLAEVAVDPGVSAGKALAKRDGGKRVLELVRSRRVRAVVAMKLDRVFRDCQDCLSVTADWDRAGVALHLIDLGGQSIDTSSAMGRFFLSIMGGAAELERNLVGERTRMALRHKASQGERIGQIPFGYKLAEDGVHLLEDEEEQATIAAIRRLAGEGLGPTAIARRLNDQITPARGTRWHKTTVARILRRVA